MNSESSSGGTGGGSGSGMPQIAFIADVAEVDASAVVAPTIKLGRRSYGNFNPHIEVGWSGRRVQTSVFAGLTCRPGLQSRCLCCIC